MHINGSNTKVKDPEGKKWDIATYAPPNQDFVCSNISGTQQRIKTIPMPK